MKFLLISLILLNCLTKACSQEQQRVEPPYPNEVSGWRYREEKGLRILGDFLLKKGEATNNGKIQIKLLELIPGDPNVDAGTINYQPRVKLQFVRVSDQKILCEEIFVEKGAITLTATKCNSSLNEFGVIGVYVNAINLKDGWVFFEVLG